MSSGAGREPSSPDGLAASAAEAATSAKVVTQARYVIFQMAEDAAAKAIVKKPVAAYVEKVYEEGNFGLLGIGT